ncbi:uncharacterized protein I303_102564 [Kwoniella dejecticola CBS 10117]|uniref:Uncharacterized protein n=1 Tax=Kwoniella dejecticola CBS 10117 TaxID=1296121 RepID=A0A1A6A936_9TREE|nr:uncharacterized protein I303_02578 [Kwoniella dejecticola CBS 10117]OBR86570.1 hypothetical protein I303_02578 [Kwoniella dejecticola CBS 10117]
MTTHLTSAQPQPQATNNNNTNNNNNPSDMPHTPREEHQPVFSSSPATSPQLMHKELDVEAAILNIHNKPEQKISRERRKYSNGLYKWTQQLWETNIESNKRKSSTSSNGSALSSNSSSSLASENNLKMQ